MKSFSIGPALLAAGLLFCTLLVPLDVLADSKKDELSSKQNQAQQAYNEARQELEELQNQQNETQSQIDQLQGQSAEVAAQLSDIYTALQDAQRLLDERTAAAEQAAQALADKQAEYDASLARCKSQMGAMQLLDGGGSIALLLQARSLYEMLTFAETLRELAAHNSAALAQLSTEAEALAAARAEAQTAAEEAETARAALDAQQAALQTTQNELGSALQATNTALTEQQAAEQAQAVVTEAARKAYLQATAELDAYARAQSSKYTTADLHLTSLAFRCPLDSYGRITTQFGEADPWGIPHRGTDFAAPGGTPVYAIADGIVSAAAAMYSYGNCVQISHGTADDGNTYDSLYAHLSSIAVSQGSAVTKGQVIGYVGNTGNVYSTGGGGYHLHLELRVNRARVNPLSYVPQ
ncbi:MAG: peptidoglycan DD-metalloendopeptidase family protein [Gemmiger sp.]|uniref:murein hydrolase activator EnvC family protein n=1 Tax=Gemmiger sp. TaxID=2049027 RepID=UPI002A917321|nr:peptidoglycan DD-metalloendopeptidase family protein [Gemmiger sp.]MDY5411946.1 peptidoglycan DD-metalloendopeptidase family protein [Gemmiger sp.]